jgi:hypothetical protein
MPNTVVLQYKFKNGAIHHRDVSQDHVHAWTVRLANCKDIEYCSVIDKYELRALLT